MGIAVPNDVVETINDLRSLAMPPVTPGQLHLKFTKYAHYMCYEI